MLGCLLLSILYFQNHKQTKMRNASKQMASQNSSASNMDGVLSRTVSLCSVANVHEIKLLILFFKYFQRTLFCSELAMCSSNQFPGKIYTVFLRYRIRAKLVDLD